MSDDLIRIMREHVEGVKAGYEAELARIERRFVVIRVVVCVVFVVWCVWVWKG